MEGDVDATMLTAQMAIARSMEYARLKEGLAEREADFASIIKTNYRRRLKSSPRLEAKKRETKTFTRDVARLARSLKNRPIESERLGRSERAFDAGDFALVSAVMDADDLRAEQEQIRERHEGKPEETEQTTDRLLRNATEFLATTDQVFAYILVMGVLSDEVEPLFPEVASADVTATDADVEPLFVKVI